MRCGVIGTGNMGRHHARVYKELGILVGICDTNETQAKKIASLHEVPYTTNVDHLLQFGLDTVTIAVPTQFHRDVAIQCLEAGCDVLLEKPLSNNIKDAEIIMETAVKTSRSLFCGYIETFNPAFQELSRRIKSGNYGKITSLNIKRVGGAPQSADNIILDVMTHDIGLLMTIFGNPDNVWTVQSSKHNMVNSAQTLFQFGDTSATCEANWLSPVKMRTIAVTGIDGYCEVDMIKQTLTTTELNRTVIEHFEGEPLKLEIQEFLQGKGMSGIKALDILRVTLQAAKIKCQ